MSDNLISARGPSPEELRAACQTLSGMPGPNSELVAKLHYVADLMVDACPLPALPLLVWRESDQKVCHAVICEMLVVGRSPGPGGLALPDDRLLSRQHFSLSVTEDGCLLQNLKSKNGTAVNSVDEPVGERLLRDGDLIIAGNHIFAFLDHGQVT